MTKLSYRQLYLVEKEKKVSDGANIWLKLECIILLILTLTC